MILKRTGQNEKRDQGQYDDGYLRIDFDKMTAQRGTETLLLTPNEYRILKLFVENAGRILTRQVLLERLYDCDDNFIDEHTLTVNMTRLRKRSRIHLINIFRPFMEWDIFLRGGKGMRHKMCETMVLTSCLQLEGSQFFSVCL